MFKNIKISSLLVDDIYFDCDVRIDLIDGEFGGIYTGGLSDIEMYINSLLFIDKDSNIAHEYIYSIFYDYPNYVFEKMIKTTCTMPIFWLIWSKSMLQWDYLPSDFSKGALAILEWFDLDRYNATYHLPEEEFTAIKNDLPLVISQLKNYPKERFAPPIGDKCSGLE